MQRNKKYNQDSFSGSQNKLETACFGSLQNHLAVKSWI